MRYRFGIDIIEAKRVKKIVDKGEKFMSKLFTKNEIEYCSSKKNPYPHFASRFAAKEAFLKAISSGWQKTGIRWVEIEVINNNYGKPEIRVIPLKHYKFMKHIRKIELTISQDKNYAVAMVAIGE